MRSMVVWVEKLKEKDDTLCIHDIAFRPDGEQLIVAAGLVVQVYSASDGKLVNSLKGHKDTVYCVSWARDGESFVSGGADKQVIIWGCDPFEGKLKYAHGDSIQKVSYNPKSPLVLSCTNTDIGLWSPDFKKSVMKEKVPSRCCSCSWTNDGQYFAVGHHNGSITFWTKEPDSLKVLGIVFTK